MQSIDYLRLAISQRLYTKKSWLIKAFSVTRVENYDPDSATYADLVRTDSGLSYVQEDKSLIRISDSKANEPLFKFSDRIKVDKSWIANAEKPIDTTIGNLLVNLIVVIEAMGPKLPFITGRFNIRKVEKDIATKLHDNIPEDQRNDKDIYVDEMLRFQTAIKFLEGISQLCTVAATRTNMLPPTGLKEFKAKLAKKYEGKLHDPVEVANYEKELLDFDNEYLKDDPSNGLFMGSRIKGTSRKKLFLSVGVEQGFETTSEVDPIERSLTDGLSDNPEHFAAQMNGARYASFSRGSETVQGGVAAKYLLRAANNYRIVEEDCGTKLGLSRHYTKDNLHKLVGRYLLEGTRTVAIEDNNLAANYVNKPLIVRSPAFCKTPGEAICKYCAGSRLAQYPTGLAVPLTNVSSGLIITSLKKMHTNTLSTAKMSIDSILS